MNRGCKKIAACMKGLLFSTYTYTYNDPVCLVKGLKDERNTCMVLQVTDLRKYIFPFSLQIFNKLRFTTKVSQIVYLN